MNGDRELEAVEAAPKRREAERARARRGQRERILAAMAEIAGTKGYRAARVADILRQAETSRPVFYAHFGGKEECLLAAFDAELPAIEEQVTAAVGDAEGCAQRAEIGLEALLGALAAEQWRRGGGASCQSG